MQAWLGNVLADDRMDLSSGQTRANVLSGVDDVLADGFDGVHFDFEPSRDNDQSFLDLLAATYPRTQAKQAVLSVATPKLEPHTGARITATLLPTLAEWSANYTRQVSRFVDQIAIMSYDTALPSERAYRGFIRRQTEIALQTVPARVDLLIGAPAITTRNSPGSTSPRPCPPRSPVFSSAWPAPRASGPSAWPSTSTSTPPPRTGTATPRTGPRTDRWLSRPVFRTAMAMAQSAVVFVR